MTSHPNMPCPVCGGVDFTENTIIDDRLAADWKLSVADRALVDEQQGLLCSLCGCNLRSMTLASGLMAVMGIGGLFARACADDGALAPFDLLEINEAGHLTPYLKTLPRYRFISYPDYDLQNLALYDTCADVVIHSDTLEHVPDGVAALRECRRILRPGGVLAYTVPMLPGRLTLSREGLPASYHGDPELRAEDYRVVREYGGDAWTECMTAGFRTVALHSFRFPSSVAILAIR